MNNNIIPFDGLAVTADDCRMICRLFGFFDTAEFQLFARTQQRKHVERQLGRFQR